MKTSRLARRSAGLLLPVAALAAVAILPAAGQRNGTVRADDFALTASIAPSPPAGSTTNLRVLGFNDFHGNISGGGNVNGAPAGGAPQFYKVLRDLRATAPTVANSATVASGDLVGASPIESGQFRDEPALDIYSLLGVDYAGVGNHEFDLGKDELLRKQNGGCNAGDNKTCVFKDPNTNTSAYPGTTMKYLSANVTVTATGKTLFPASAVRTVGSQKVGFIGVTLKDTPSVVTPAGVAGLTFSDEADAANAEVARIQSSDSSVKTFVLQIHQGGAQGAGGSFNDCSAFEGQSGNAAILDVTRRLGPAIPVVLSAHSHQTYNCAVDAGANGPKLLTSAGFNGRFITGVDMVLNGDGTLSSATATNNLVGTTANTLTAGADPTYDKVKAVVDAANTQVGAIKNRVVGQAAEVVDGNAVKPSGETSLGDVIADAQLDNTRSMGAVAAFMNPGGIRNTKRLPNNQGGTSPQPNSGDITYGMLFNVQPFNNGLTTKTFTGADLKQLLEQQYVGCFGQTTQRVLQVSESIRYTYDQGRPACDRVVPSSFTIGGAVVNPTSTYRVTMNSFLASGGDGFTTFNNGTNSQTGNQDIDALETYVAKQPSPGLRTTEASRITFVAAVPAAAVPEVAYAVGLPLAALMVAGGAMFLAVRRRRTV